MPHFIRNEALETQLLVHPEALPDGTSGPLWFSINEMRKSSDHRSICATVYDESKTPICVVKTPEKASQVAAKALISEQQNLERVHQLIQTDAVPKPIGGFVEHNHVFVTQSYIENELLYKQFLANTKLYNTDWILTPIKWRQELDRLTNRQSIADEIIIWMHAALEHVMPAYEELKMALEPFVRDTMELARRSKSLPFVWGHGDYNSWNIGSGSTGLAVFDWEDAGDAPVLGDVYYYSLSAFWCLFFDESKLKTAYITENMEVLITQVANVIDEYVAEYQLTEDQVVLTWRLFILRNLCLELAEKRQSPKDSIDRWTDMIFGIDEMPHITAFFEAKKKVLLTLVPS